MTALARWRDIGEVIARGLGSGPCCARCLPPPAGVAACKRLRSVPRPPSRRRRRPIRMRLLAAGAADGALPPPARNDSPAPARDDAPRELRLFGAAVALLAYIALAGPTTRTRVADVFWGALDNASARLHRLARARARAAGRPAPRRAAGRSRAPRSHRPPAPGAGARARVAGGGPAAGGARRRCGAAVRRRGRARTRAGAVRARPHHAARRTRPRPAARHRRAGRAHPRRPSGWRRSSCTATGATWRASTRRSLAWSGARPNSPRCAPAPRRSR